MTRFSRDEPSAAVVRPLRPMRPARTRVAQPRIQTADLVTVMLVGATLVAAIAVMLAR